MPWTGPRDDFGLRGDELWIPVEYGDRAIQRIAEGSVVERIARREPMAEETKNVPRLTGFQVGTVEKGTAYALSVSTKDRLNLIAQKVGGAAKLAEEDITGDAQADPLAALRLEGADALALHYDNSCLATTGQTIDFDDVKYRSVYAAVNGTPDAFDAAFGYTAGANHEAIDASEFRRARVDGDGNEHTNGYDVLSDLLGRYETSRFFSDPDTRVIAHPAYKNLMRGMKNANGDPLMAQVGVNALGRPVYEVFGYPVEFAHGARTSAVNTQAPEGNPLLIVGNRRMLIRGTRALAPQIPADTFGVALQRSSQGVGFLSDEAFMKVAFRRAFNVGTAQAFAVLEVDLSQ
jgi:hypothetical protein